MTTTTVRVTPQTRDELADAARELGAGSADEAIRTLVFWWQVDRAYDRLQADPLAWTDYRRETAELVDAGIADGLEREEPWTE